MSRDIDNEHDVDCNDDDADDRDDDDDDIVVLHGVPSHPGWVSNGQIQARPMQITREKV